MSIVSVSHLSWSGEFGDANSGLGIHPWTNGVVPIVKIEGWHWLWQGSPVLKGLRVSWADGAQVLNVVDEGTYTAISLSPGEIVTEALLYLTGQWPCGFTLKTNLNPAGLTVGTTSGSSVSVPVTGILTGLSCHSGSWINSLQFGYIASVVSVSYTNVTYDFSGLNTPALVPLQVAEIEAKNDSASEETTNVSGAFAVSSQRSWSTTDGLSRSVELTVKAGTPEIGIGAELKMSKTETHSLTAGHGEADNESFNYSVTVNVPPNATRTGTAVLRGAPISVPFVCDATYTFSDGSQQATQYSGVYQGVAAYHVEVTWN